MALANGTADAKPTDIAPSKCWADTDQAAKYIGVSRKTLESWRATGVSPRYCKAGRRCMYRLDWIEEWLVSRAVTSTAEARRSGLI
jgi:hypothetical protein